MITVHYDTIETPLGTILLTSNGTALTGIHFERQRYGLTPAPAWVRSPAAVAQARVQLEEYFEGRRRSFDLRLEPPGTAFQRRVWTALSRVPWGATTTYGALARELGMATAARAVGAAVGRNPLGIVVPCHRVIGSDGSLTGYAGGLDRKRWLLALESAQQALRA